jgi:hypothetical protein
VRGFIIAEGRIAEIDAIADPSASAGSQRLFSPTSRSPRIGSGLLCPLVTTISCGGY